MTMNKVAERIVSEDMGARKMTAFIRECWNDDPHGMALLEYTEEISEMVTNLLTQE